MKLFRTSFTWAVAALLSALSLSFVASADAPTATTSAPPVPAPANTTVAAAPAPAASTAAPKLICEDETQLGTHFRKRICLSPEQVKEREKAARDMFRNMNQNSKSC